MAAMVTGSVPWSFAVAAREAEISDWVKGGPWHILALHFSICCKILQDVASFRWKLAKKEF